MIEKVSMQIVLEVPADASLFACSGVSCFTDESTYPVSSAMVPDIQNIILTTVLKIEANSPSDQKANSKHDLQPNIEQE